LLAKGGAGPSTGIGVFGRTRMTVKATDASFEQEVLKSDTPVLVDFWAEWCGPCRMIGPSLEDIAKEMDGKLKVVKVNIDENPQAPTRYGVRSIPTLLLFKNGQVAATKIGAEPKQKLVSWINTVVS
jgi:thioredoxin 1